MASKQTPSDFFAPDIIVDNIINFACSQIKHRRTDGKPDPIPPGWIVENLIREGRLGWLHANDPSEGMYLVQGDYTRSRYGEPTMVALRSQATSAASFNVPTDYDGIAPGKVSILSANTTETPPVLYIERVARVIAKLDMVIYGNTLASSRTQIIGMDRKQGAILKSLFNDVEQGLPTVIQNEIAAMIQRIDISAQFIGNDYYALRRALMSDILKQFGAVTPTMYKAERTQSAEVNASVGEAIDNVYVMIDQFNRDAEDGEAPYELYYGGYGVRYDTDDVSATELPNDRIDPGSMSDEGGTPNA